MEITVWGYGTRGAWRYEPPGDIPPRDSSQSYRVRSRPILVSERELLTELSGEQYLLRPVRHLMNLGLACLDESNHLMDLLGRYNPRWRWLRYVILKMDMTSFFSAEGGPIWIKFRRLVQNDMSSVDCGDVWKWKPDVEFRYGGRLGEFNGMSSQSHVSHCRVLPLGEFTVTIPEPHATLQGARIPSAILKIIFRHILFCFCF